MLNKVRVTICGKEYALQTDEVPSYTINLAKKLDTQINSIMSSSDNISVTAAAVLTALGAMDEAYKANENLDNIRTQITGYVDEAAKARAERDEAVKEMELLKTKIACLENDAKLKKLKDMTT